MAYTVIVRENGACVLATVMDEIGRGNELQDNSYLAEEWTTRLWDADKATRCLLLSASRHQWLYYSALPDQHSRDSTSDADRSSAEYRSGQVPQR